MTTRTIVKIYNELHTLMLKQGEDSWNEYSHHVARPSYRLDLCRMKGAENAMRLMERWAQKLHPPRVHQVFVIEQGRYVDDGE